MNCILSTIVRLTLVASLGVAYYLRIVSLDESFYFSLGVVLLLTEVMAHQSIKRDKDREIEAVRWLAIRIAITVGLGIGYHTRFLNPVGCFIFNLLAIVVVTEIMASRSRACDVDSETSSRARDALGEILEYYAETRRTIVSNPPPATLDHYIIDLAKYGLGDKNRPERPK
jgi:hypothetical protein